ncbi:prophage tail fiber N-terminal domain-containing protein [Yersinia enterocolitica]|nr:prophage tail fiber N-terminal domain-containing protein [Yersinia enterocolitica]HEI6775436.1 prophage tail fiber N-terminal domain-containing protein [Yersinia enterocolitica]HEI6777317.1 prophage tail fiber N-terminal domain-containing protein [Yersinia enterocolitica]HEI6838438.1 prophage tail fiber N-terminal domain-containing protein [Yersinia enterocolitica]HEI6876255.1 prophage tail fiber N-terminal domain-containing protein [Yersinia enterocolitica]
MSVKISGTLIDGAGIPMSWCDIILKARVNTSDVVTRTVAQIKTDVAGEYSFDAQVGKYSVYLKPDSNTEYSVGDITVYENSKPGTLNDFLIALDEGDLKPDVVKRFEELVAQAQQSADMAAESAQQVSQSVQDVTKAKDDAKRYAADAQTSATAAAESQNVVAKSEKQAKSSAQASAQSAIESADSAEAAKRAEAAAIQILAGSLKKESNLSEIAAAGTEAQQQARHHLGLGDAATMNVQSDIYDRTEGRLALPGALGFGGYFRRTKYFSGNNGPAEFMAWVRETPPGRYYVSQFAGSQQIIPGVVFSGMIEIIIPSTVGHNEDQRQKGKLILFSGVNGDLYLNRLYTNSITADGFIGWENLKLKISDFTNALRSTTGNSWRSPGVGGLIFAAYCGDSDDDNNRNLARGKGVSGSRLGMLSISAKCSTSGSYTSTPQFIVTSPNSYPQAGSFIALSGSTLTTLSKTEAFVGLFIRIA